MQVYVIYDEKNGIPVEVTTKPFADVVKAYGLPEQGTEFGRYTRQGAVFQRKNLTLVARAMQINE